MRELSSLKWRCKIYRNAAHLSPNFAKERQMLLTKGREWNKRRSYWNEAEVKNNQRNNISLMRMLSGTAVRVDSTLNDMQVDLSPCQHLSLPPQSLIQRQPNSVWEYCVLCRHLNTNKHTHTHSLCIYHPSFYLLTGSILLCFTRIPFRYLQATCTSVRLCRRAPTRFLTMQR